MKKRTNVKLFLIVVAVWSVVAYSVNSSRPPSTSTAAVAALETLR